LTLGEQIARREFMGAQGAIVRERVLRLLRRSWNELGGRK
jgi:hypothetical protein